jgi:hypothetical protein
MALMVFGATTSGYEDTPAQRPAMGGQKPATGGWIRKDTVASPEV